MQQGDDIARGFCDLFCSAHKTRRYILGRNVYAKSVIAELDVEGVIDDFTNELTFEGVPIVRSVAVPKYALVLNASGGRPFTAKAQLDSLGLRNLDFFTFRRLTNMDLPDVVFNEGFNSEYERNHSEYEWISSRFADEISRETFDRLVGFRRSLETRYLEGFKSNEPAQYFETFLNLKNTGEVFIDVGCFNGLNSLEFARRAPHYRSIYAFEPDPDNYQVCVRNLEELRDVHLHNIGLSDRRETLRFSSDGSGSKISEAGAVEIVVDRMDAVVTDAPTFIKMDIEGAEFSALSGAKELITRAHPRLAVCVYHNVGDFHRIPRLIMEMRDDYSIYLRHYTETIYETVMFFIPQP